MSEMRLKHHLERFAGDDSKLGDRLFSLLKDSAHVASPEDESADGLLDVLAAMRATQMLHQNAHWNVCGPPFYGDHLLFERLYEALEEDIDVLAEKIVATYGEHCIVPFDQTLRVLECIGECEELATCPVTRSLAAEELLLSLLHLLYEFLEEAGTLSLGMDDFIMASANQHEEAIYLLRQRLR